MGILLNDLEKLICKNEITIALRKTQVKPLALIRSEKSSHINHVAIQEDTKDPRGSSGDMAGGRTRGTLFQKEYVHFPCGGGSLKIWEEDSWKTCVQLPSPLEVTLMLWFCSEPHHRSNQHSLMSDGLMKEEEEKGSWFSLGCRG